MTRQRMRHADAAWLRMDSPTNLMVVNSVMWFDGPLDEDVLRTVIQQRLVDRFPRFRQRVAEEGGIWWEDDPDFDLSRHLRRAALPAPARRRELEAFVAARLVEPLDREHPLWEVHLIDGYYGGSALVFRMHHCIADGIALTRVLLSMTDDPESEPVALDTVAGHPQHGLVAQVGSEVVHQAIDVAFHPGHLLDLARTGVGDAKALAKLLLMLPDSQASQRRTGPDKQVVWSDPIPLHRVKDACAASGATVNDLLLAALTSALRAQQERRGEKVHDFRAIVPFNLRPLDEPLPTELGNQFGLVFLTLPIESEDRHTRLELMSQRMSAIKSSAEGVVSYGILDLVGQLPDLAEKAVIDLFAAKGSAVVTNVPGPRRPVSLAGRTLRGTIGWVPMSGDIGLGVSIFSYAGDIVVGLSTDRLQVDDGHALLEDFMAELQALVAGYVGS